MKIFICALFFLGYSPFAFAQDEGEPSAQVEEAVDAPAEEAPAEEAPVEVEAEEAPVEVEAEEVSEDSEAVADSASLIAQAIQDKNWALLAGILLSLLVAFANRFGLKDKVGSKAIPWVTSGVAVAGAVSVALLAGIPILEALSQGLLAGVTAIGGWEMFLKHVLTPKKSEQPAA